MAQLKYDVSDVEAGGGGVEPSPGLYPGKIVSITHRKKKADNTPCSDLEVVLDIGPEYVRLWTYIQLPDSPSYDNAKWKLREFTDALDLPAKGAFDPKKLEGKPVMVKTKMRRDDPERAEVKNLFKPGAEVVGKAEAATLADEEGDTDYASWSVEDLTAEIEERNLDMPAGRKSVDKLAAVLVADDEETAGAAGDEGDPSEEFDIKTVEGFEDWDEWGAEDLKQELAAREITLEGRYSEAKARTAIIDSVAEELSGEEGTEAGGEAAPEDEYDTFTDQELKDEITERVEGGAEIEVKGRWTRDKAIEALRADDQANPF